MNNVELVESIRKKAIEYGFANCGVISIDKMEGFKKLYRKRIFKAPTSWLVYRTLKLSQTKKRFPWAKSVIVCTYWLGKFKFPKELQGKYAKAFILSQNNEKINKDYKEREKFEKWLEENGIRYEGGDKLGHGSIGSLRYAAVTAGLGIIRKNNFFYDERGSCVELVAYVIDKECELIHKNNLKECSPKCDLCQKACQTKALKAPNTMEPLKCISFWTTFGKGAVPPNLKKEMFREWICGCDDCQDVCPFNRRHNWEVGEDLEGLAELSSNLMAEKIKDASDEFLINNVASLTDNHILSKDVSTLRKNAKRALSYKK